MNASHERVDGTALISPIVSMNQRPLSGALLICVAAANACAVARDSGTTRVVKQNDNSAFVKIDAPDSRATIASAINDDGLVVGRYNDTTGTGLGQVHGFRRAGDGTITSYDVPKATLTALRGVNARGAVSGQYSLDRSGAFRRGMVVENGVVTDYVFPLAQQTMAFNLNNKGVVVGWLERAYETHDQGLTFLKHAAFLRSLRGDPRYTSLLRKMNLPVD